MVDQITPKNNYAGYPAEYYVYNFTPETLADRTACHHLGGNDQPLLVVGQPLWLGCRRDPCHAVTGQQVLLDVPVFIFRLQGISKQPTALLAVAQLLVFPGEGGFFQVVHPAHLLHRGHLQGGVDYNQCSFLAVPVFVPAEPVPWKDVMMPLVAHHLDEAHTTQNPSWATGSCSFWHSAKVNDLSVKRGPVAAAVRAAVQQLMQPSDDAVTVALGELVVGDPAPATSSSTSPLAGADPSVATPVVGPPNSADMHEIQARELPFVSYYLTLLKQAKGVVGDLERHEQVPLTTTYVGMDGQPYVSTNYADLLFEGVLYEFKNIRDCTDIHGQLLAYRRRYDRLYPDKPLKGLKAVVFCVYQVQGGGCVCLNSHSDLCQWYDVQQNLHEAGVATEVWNIVEDLQAQTVSYLLTSY